MRKPNSGLSVLSGKPHVRGIPWGYIPKEGISNGDSAVSVIWDEVRLAVGQTKSYVTYYGLSSFDTSVLDNYSVSITAPQSLDVSSSENDYEPNPFTVVAYIQNISSSQRNNILVKIVLPSELTLFDNSTQTIEIASLAPNEMKTVSWVIFATAQSSEKTAQYNIQIDDGINVNEVAASITLPQVFQNEIVLEDLGFSRTAGIEYEQTTDLFDTSVKPAIKNVRIAAIDTNIGKYRLEIGPDDFECASYITPFFFWKSKDGSFSEVDSTYQAVTFTADPGTGDNKVSASAYIGDSLGYVEEYKVFVDGSSITSGSEELTCAFISPFSNINGWSTMDIRFNAYLEEDGIIQNGTIIDLYYLDTTHGDQSWEPIVRDMIDKTAYQWMVPNKSLPLTKLKLVACNGGKASIIESSSFSITPTLYVYGKILTINSEPICGTVVNLSNGMQAITDESGSFMFRDVNAGTYTLSAEGGNYVTSSYTVTVNNTNTQVNRIFRQR